MEKKDYASCPGIAADEAVKSVTPAQVEQETKELNNNPRNNDIDESTPVEPLKE